MKDDAVTQTTVDGVLCFYARISNDAFEIKKKKKKCIRVPQNGSFPIYSEISPRPFFSRWHPYVVDSVFDTRAIGPDFGIWR